MLNGSNELFFFFGQCLVDVFLAAFIAVALEWGKVATTGPEEADAIDNHRGFFQSVGLGCRVSASLFWSRATNDRGCL